MKKYMGKLLGAWLIGSILSLYTTFVIMNLWDWFASPAFHVPEISFWLTFGLVLLVGLFEKGDAVAEVSVESIMAAVIATVPQERRAEVEAEVSEYLKEKMGVDVWLKGGAAAFGRFAVNSLVLGLGFAVHTFLT